MTHYEDIDTAAKLLHYLHQNTLELLPIILAFGGFVGFCLVGIDPYVKSIFSTRFVYAIHRYFLSSKVFKFPFFYFMGFRLMRQRFQRLGLDLIGTRAREELAKIARRAQANGGPYEEKCLLREMIADFSWSTIPTEARANLTERREMSSMFLTMALITVFLLIFQFIFYLDHIFYEGVVLSDLLILVPLGYMILNLLWNAATRSEEPWGERPEMKTATRKSYYILSLVIIGSLASILYLNVFAIVPWFSVADPLLFCVFIILYFLLYWAGAFRYSHYTLNYERQFHSIEERIVEYANSNYTVIKKTIDDFVPRVVKRITVPFIALILVAVSLAGVGFLVILWPFINTYMYTRILDLMRVRGWLSIFILAIVFLDLVLLLIISFYLFFTARGSTNEKKTHSVKSVIWKLR